MSATEKKAPELVLHDDMVKRAARALDRAYDRHEMALEQVARDVLEAAFEEMPITNYGVGLALQFFDLVICVKDFESRPAAGVYQATSPETFDALPHDIEVSYGYVGDGSMNERERYIKRIAISKLPAPEDKD